MLKCCYQCYRSIDSENISEPKRFLQGIRGTGCNIEKKWIKLFSFSVVQSGLQILEITCRR